MLDQKIREIMTPHPVCLPASATVVEAAELMRANNIGDVIITEGTALAGIVTDRDLVVRAIPPASTRPRPAWPKSPPRTPWPSGRTNRPRTLCA